MVWGDVLALFLRPRNPFPGNEDRRRRRLGSNEELMRRKSEHLVLAGPFGRQVGEADDAHAVRERPSIAALTRSGARKGPGSSGWVSRHGGRMSARRDTWACHAGFPPQTAKRWPG